MGQASSFDDLLSGKTKDAGKNRGHKSHLVENTRMFAPCPRPVLERTTSTYMLGVKRASGPDHPCATDVVYMLNSLPPARETCL
ncbi:MAG: hypothetical protein DF221_09200 [Brevibacillus sp.]|nr:MAG: hypothetical protein DF221_09200 [Brevibacillus sp.]